MSPIYSQHFFASIIQGHHLWHIVIYYDLKMQIKVTYIAKHVYVCVKASIFVWFLSRVKDILQSKGTHIDEGLLSGVPLFLGGAQVTNFLIGRDKKYYDRS